MKTKPFPGVWVPPHSQGSNQSGGGGDSMDRGSSKKGPLWGGDLVPQGNRWPPGTARGASEGRSAQPPVGAVPPRCSPRANSVHADSLFPMERRRARTAEAGGGNGERRTAGKRLPDSDVPRSGAWRRRESTGRDTGKRRTWALEGGGEFHIRWADAFFASPG